MSTPPVPSSPEALAPVAVVALVSKTAKPLAADPVRHVGRDRDRVSARLAREHSVNAAKSFVAASAWKNLNVAHTNVPQAPGQFIYQHAAVRAPFSHGFARADDTLRAMQCLARSRHCCDDGQGCPVRRGRPRPSLEGRWRTPRRRRLGAPARPVKWGLVFVVVERTASVIARGVSSC
jgi:hypothetical protein